MRELDDVTLQLAIKGNRDAFRKLYDTYAPFIWRVLYSMAMRDSAAARELVQDTFIKVHGALHQFKGGSALSTWLYRIAFTTAMSYRRKQAKNVMFQVYTDNVTAPDRSDGYDSDELAAIILAGLSDEERFILVAREVDGLPFDELAKITGITSGTLRTRVHRLKETIRREYSNEHFVECGV